MAAYPFVRLEEERRRLAGRRRRRDRLRQGRSERADRSDDPAGARRRAARARAVSARAGPARSCARRRQAGSSGASASPSIPDTEIVPTYGSKEAIFSLAQVLDTGGPVGRRSASRRTRSTSAARSSPARRCRRCRCGARTASSRISTRARRRRRARLGQLPAQPDGRGRAARVLRASSRRRAERHDFVIASDEAYTRALVRRAAAVGAAGGGPLARRRLPDAEQALVDDRLPLRVRRGAAGDRRGAEGVPPDGRDGAAGVRPARVGRRVERRAARRGDARALPREARRADPGDREPRLGDRRERGDDVPLGRSGRIRDALLERGLIVSPGELFGPSGEGYVRFALVPTLEECERAAAILRELP